jgi:hypothetical protein
MGRHSAHSNSAGRSGPPARPSPRSEWPASPTVKVVCEAGQTTPDCGQGGTAEEEKGEQLGGGGRSGAKANQASVHGDAGSAWTDSSRALWS